MNFMRKATIIILIAVLVPTFPALAKKLIYSEKFEKFNPENLPLGWKKTVIPNTPVLLIQDKSDVHSGKSCLLVHINPPGGCIIIEPSKKIQGIKPGKHYEVRVWVKPKNLGYSSNFIAPAFRYNYAPRRISPHPTIDLIRETDPKKGWQLLSKTTVAPAGAKAITIDFMLTRGSIRIDDLEIFCLDE